MELEQSEKKRATDEYEIEGVNKRQKADDDYRDDAFLGFSDSDSDDNDFTEYAIPIETNGTADGVAVIADEQNGHVAGTRCLEVDRCDTYQHKQLFRGLPLFELFKVRVKFNENYCMIPIRGRLYGEITSACDRENPYPIPYYSVSRNEVGFIDLHAGKDFAILPITGPKPRPLFFRNNNLYINFAFKVEDEDAFNDGINHRNPRLFGNSVGKAGFLTLNDYPGICSRRNISSIGRVVVGAPSMDRILMGAYYSTYYGSWATIDVKLPKESDATTIYGLVVARPCIFYRRIRLLTIDQQKKVTIQRNHEGEGCIELTRSMVTVPSYASLVIGAALYDAAGNPICRGKLAFPAKESGVEIDSILYNGVKALEVRVTWA